MLRLVLLAILALFVAPAATTTTTTAQTVAVLAPAATTTTTAQTVAVLAVAILPKKADHMADRSWVGRHRKGLGRLLWAKLNKKHALRRNAYVAHQKRISHMEVRNAFLAEKEFDGTVEAARRIRKINSAWGEAKATLRGVKKRRLKEESMLLAEWLEAKDRAAAERRSVEIKARRAKAAQKREKVRAARNAEAALWREFNEAKRLAKTNTSHKKTEMTKKIDPVRVIRVNMAARRMGHGGMSFSSLIKRGWITKDQLDAVLRTDRERRILRQTVRKLREQHLTSFIYSSPEGIIVSSLNMEEEIGKMVSVRDAHLLLDHKIEAVMTAGI